jgi:methionine aminopeptidase
VSPADLTFRVGIAFPTTINVNHIACHFAPLAVDPEAALELKDGDMVKM